jgi:hypothetical protein
MADMTQTITVSIMASGMPVRAFNKASASGLLSAGDALPSGMEIMGGSDSVGFDAGWIDTPEDSAGESSLVLGLSDERGRGLDQSLAPPPSDIMGLSDAGVLLPIEYGTAGASGVIIIGETVYSDFGSPPPSPSDILTMADLSDTADSFDGDGGGLSLGTLASASIGAGARSFKQCAGLYQGMVPVDVEMDGAGLSIGMLHMRNGAWNPCSMPSGSPLPTGWSKVWWDAGRDLSRQSNTKLAVFARGSGAESAHDSNQTGMFEASPFSPPTIVPLMRVDDWAVPASGNPPSGVYVAVNAAGRPASRVRVRMGQDCMGEDRFAFPWLQDAVLTGCSFSNGVVSVAEGSTYGFFETRLDSGSDREWKRFEAESRVSTGQVRHFFKTGDDIIHASSKDWIECSASLSAVGRGRWLLWKCDLHGDAQARSLSAMAVHRGIETVTELSPLPVSFLYETISDWRSCLSDGTDIVSDPGSVKVLSPNPSGLVQGEVDAGRDVEWGTFRTAADLTRFRFRTASNREDLSSQPWSDDVEAAAGDMGSGGTRVETTLDGSPYTLHIFESSGSFTVLNRGHFDVLVVAGGGGGGGGT